MVEHDAETAEILRLLDSRLDIEDRRALLMMREGVQVPKRIRREVEQAVMAILEEVGLSAADLGFENNFAEFDVQCSEEESNRPGLTQSQTPAA